MKVLGSLHMDCLSLSLSLLKAYIKQVNRFQSWGEAEREEQSSLTFDLQWCISLVVQGDIQDIPSGCGRYLIKSFMWILPSINCTPKPKVVLHQSASIIIIWSNMWRKAGIVFHFIFWRQCLGPLSIFVAVSSCLGEKPVDYKSKWDLVYVSCTNTFL